MITISPGHWSTGGAVDLLNEVTEARKVTNQVVKILRDSKIPVTHIEDNVSRNQRDNLNYLVSQHNKTDRKLDVSIHFNSSKRTDKGLGVEVLYYDQRELAAKISKAISQASGLIDRGAKERKELAFLNGTHKPAILIEVCFVSSTVDEALYKRDFDKICKAIAKELAAYCGKNIGEGEKMKFSSPSLKAETEVTLNSKARRTLIVEAAVRAGAHSSWLVKHEKGEMTEADYLGLAAKAVIDPQL